MLSPIQIVKIPSHHVACHKLLFFNQWFKQSTAHDFKALFCTGRPPGGLNTTNSVSQPVKGRTASLTADFNIIGLGMWRPGGI